MKTALIILVFIVLGLGGFYFYTTRYFRDLYGENSILYSRQSIRIDQRFWPFRFFESLMNLLLLGMGLVSFYFSLWAITSDNRNSLVILLLLLLTFVCIALPVLLYLINRKLLQLNDYEYIFDPNEKTLEVVGITKIYKEDIREIQSLIGGRYYANTKKIICKDGSSIILSDFLPCFDVISEFFGEGISRSYKDYDLITYTIKLYNGTLTELP
jgi:hypothetical protein